MNRVKKQANVDDDGWYERYVSLDYRMGELLMVWDVAFKMDENLVTEVWGRLKWIAAAEWVRLAAVRGDVCEAVEQANFAANEIERRRRVI